MVALWNDVVIMVILVWWPSEVFKINVRVHILFLDNCERCEITLVYKKNIILRRTLGCFYYVIISKKLAGKRLCSWSIKVEIIGRRRWSKNGQHLLRDDSVVIMLFVVVMVWRDKWSSLVSRVCVNHCLSTTDHCIFCPLPSASFLQSSSKVNGIILWTSAEFISMLFKWVSV